MAKLYLLLALSQLISLTFCQNANSTDTRIIGGDNIYDPIPYQISIQRLSNNQWKHFCSGAIISADFVLTAAHCMNGRDPKLMSIVAGVTSLSSPYGSRNFVQGYKIHEEFESLHKCDIALVKVFPPFEFNQMTISAISFTDTVPVGGGIPVVLTGWGTMTQTGYSPLADNLQVLVTNTMDNSECQKSFPKLKSTEICTFRTVGRGACNGDSGGPLVSYDRTRLIGTVAFGTKTCANGFPDFFTRVSEFVGWILAGMGEPFPIV